MMTKGVRKCNIIIIISNNISHKNVLHTQITKTKKPSSWQDC